MMLSMLCAPLSMLLLMPLSFGKRGVKWYESAMQNDESTAVAEKTRLINLEPLEQMPKSDSPAGLESITDINTIVVDSAVVDSPPSETQDDVLPKGDTPAGLENSGYRRRRRRRTKDSEPRDCTDGTHRCDWLCWGGQQIPTGACEGARDYKYYGGTGRYVKRKGNTFFGMCSTEAFGQGNPAYGDTKGCWCLTNTTGCPAGQAFDAAGNCKTLQIIGTWEMVKDIAAGTSYTITRGMTSHVGGSEAALDFSASFKASSAAFVFPGIGGGGSSTTKMKAQTRFESAFGSFKYDEHTSSTTQYNRDEGRWLFQFQYVVKVDGKTVLTAKETFCVQADTAPKCPPTQNYNDDYSQC